MTVLAALPRSYAAVGDPTTPALTRPSIRNMNPAARSPVDRGVVPQTMFRSGLRRTPPPIDNTSELIVTGHIGGGKHFRGVLPYNALSDFSGRIDESTILLDSFLRRSGGSGEGGRYLYTGDPTPFYSQTGSVTISRFESPRIITPPTTRLEGRADATTSVPGLQDVSELARPTTDIPGMRFLPLGRNLEEMEEQLNLKDEEIDEAKYRQEMEKLRQDLAEADRKAAELKEKLLVEDKPPKVLETPPKPPVETLVQKPKTEPEAEEQLPESEQYPKPDKPSEKIPDRSESRRPEVQPPRLIVGKTPGPPGGEEEGTEDETAVSGRRKDIHDMEAYAGDRLRIIAKGILGEHEDFASLAAEKYEHYMAVGLGYLRKGRHYRAADAFSLAAAYRPDMPRAAAFKSYALFAAGEYVSSALFLSKALEAQGGLAAAKIDMESVFGDNELLDNRINDLGQWAERTGSWELQFLLAYYYRQTGRTAEAAAAINSAAEKAPDSAAVAALKAAIE